MLHVIVKEKLPRSIEEQMKDNFIDSRHLQDAIQKILCCLFEWLQIAKHYRSNEGKKAESIRRIAICEHKTIDSIQN